MQNSSIVAIAAVLGGLGCAREAPPDWPVSPPSELCGDPALGEEGFCMPSARIERWLRRGEFTVTDSAISDSGTTAPHKMRVVVKDKGRTLSFNVKFKPAPEELDAFNNSPRRELAAYDIQKLVLDEDEWVVPPTILTCLPVARYGSLLGDAAPFEGTDCILGIMAYWVEHVDDDVYDPDRLADDRAYARHMAQLNAVTVLIGHQDNIGSNFLIAEDPKNPRLVAIDNGLAFGAFGANPFQLVSDAWSRVRVETMPRKLVERLKTLDRDDFAPLAVVAQLEQRGRELVAVPATAPIDPHEGVRREGSVVQLGLTVDEITDVHLRLVDMLGSIEGGEVRIVN
jgi:hypothetical protein